jgi:hypothetical protein
MRRVTGQCDDKPGFLGRVSSRSGNTLGITAAPDAGTYVWIHVQISHFVTKVLIPKKFRCFVPHLEVTNLETKI